MRGQAVTDPKPQSLRDQLANRSGRFSGGDLVAEPDHQLPRQIERRVLILDPIIESRHTVELRGTMS